jgi:cyclophilin family peptidyl-prolyl cis-trans isomerase
MKIFLALIVICITAGFIWFLTDQTKGIPKPSITDIPLTSSQIENTAINLGETTTPNTGTVGGDITQSNNQKTMEQQYTTATFVTSLGDITLELDTKNTPNTVANFTKLAEKGFYNGTRFHRVIAGFMIQGGDPLSADTSKKAYWGTGGPGYQFADEIKSTNDNKIGTISMANAGPNTNGSQFFINVANNDFLNTKHTVFGRVISGMETVSKIALTKVDDTDKPLADVIITKIILK